MEERDFFIIAGPCAVESREQIIRIAKKLKSLDIDMLRGGTYKPRTNINSFQGLREEGLKYLLEAKEITGLPIITELLTINQVEEYGNIIDIIQIGSRNMYNYELLKAVGKTRKPILLKRGLSATYNEWISACEYIKSNGNENIILCERGIRTFEKETRNTLDLQAIPYIKNNSNYPVFVDPSHAAGNRYMIESMSLAAVASGCDGLMIEVHDFPDEALCDSEQAITVDKLSDICYKTKKLKREMKQY